jgi:2-polyprenyl-3-methyl-5-hydroxy-6-metoxy-1,4-benzoquinol methylase
MTHTSTSKFKHVGDAVCDFYNNIKFPGEYTAESLQYHIPNIRNPYLDKIDQAFLSCHKTVLDVGCGSGLITNLFALKYPEVKFTGLDFANGVHHAEFIANTVGITNVVYVKEDFLSVNLEQQYDLVICQGVLHHIPDHTSALEKLKQLVSPGGTLVIGLYHPWGKILKKLIAINYHNDVLYRDQEHHVYETAYTCEQVNSMFDNDFELVDSYPANNPLTSRMSALLNSRNGGLTTYIWRKLS